MPKDPFNSYTNQRTGTERKIAAGRARREFGSSLTTSESADPRENEFQKRLGLLLADYRERNPAINRDTAREMEKLVRDACRKAKLKGIQVHTPRVVYFTAMNYIAVWPHEMSEQDLNKRVHQLIVHRQRHGLSIDADDLAKGLRRAYPEFTPSRHNIIIPQQETKQ